MTRNVPKSLKKISNEVFGKENIISNNLNINDEFVKYLRNKYNIPENKKCFFCMTDIETKLSKKYQKENITSFTFDEDDLEVEIKSIDGYLEYKDVIYITVAIDHFDEEHTYVFAETEEILEKSLKGLYKDKTVKSHKLKNGIYKLGKSPFGIIATKIKQDENTRPFLNKEYEKEILNEIEIFNSKQEFYNKNKISFKRGVLMYGPPGNGKSSLLKSLDYTKAIGIFLNTNSDSEIEWVTDFVGNYEYKDYLKIIIMEDLDRTEGYNRSEILNLLDGINPVYRTVFIATTNYPHKLDDSFTKRPSRFDNVINIDFPNKKTRKKIIEHYFDIHDNKILEEASELTKGFSGAFIKEIMILSEYYDLDIKKSIIKIKDKMKMFKDSFNNDDSETYFG